MSMKLTLRQEWKPRPLNSFLGFVDLKLGVTLILLFAVFNKVAGIYGLIAMLTGAGGSFAQLSMYIYSVIMLVALWFGLKAVSEEDPKRTLYFAHVFFADHVLSTAWIAFFAVVWWVYTPHDGRQQSHSAAQQYIIDVAGGGHEMSDEERAAAAMAIWRKEKGTAAAIIVAGWCAKIYFAILIYSYAVHLRRGSYRNLPRTNHALADENADYIALHGRHDHLLDPESMLDEDEDIPADDFYQTAGTSSSSKSSRHNNHAPHNPPASARTPGTGGSITSFADFITAPSRGRSGRRSSRPGSASFRSAEFGFPKSPALRGSSSFSSAVGGGRDKDKDVVEEPDEVLFDSDEPNAGGGRFTGTGTSTTEENVSVSSSEARGDGPSSRRGR